MRFMNFEIAMRIETKVPPPGVRDASALADWAESVVLVEERETLGRGPLRGRLGDAGPGDEVELGLLFSEVRRRHALANAVYPFRLTELGITRTHVDPSVYEFLLTCSLEDASFRSEARWREANNILDWLTREALRTYLGGEAEAVLFSWPVADSDGRPQSFDEAVTWLADKLNLPEGSGERTPWKKDGGVDVVAWRPFKDGRSAYTIVLAQCTVRMKFEAKGRDIRLRKWGDWISFGSDPITALSVPFAVPATFLSWNEIRYDVTLILDRLRICEMLGTRDLTSQGQFEEMLEWNRREREALRL